MLLTFFIKLSNEWYSIQRRNLRATIANTQKYNLQLLSRRYKGRGNKFDEWSTWKFRESNDAVNSPRRRRRTVSRGLNFTLFSALQAVSERLELAPAGGKSEPQVSATSKCTLPFPYECHRGCGTPISHRGKIHRCTHGASKSRLVSRNTPLPPFRSVQRKTKENNEQC